MLRLALSCFVRSDDRFCFFCIRGREILIPLVSQILFNFVLHTLFSSTHLANELRYKQKSKMKEKLRYF